MYLETKTKYSRDMLKHLIGVTGKKDGVIAEAGPGLGHFALECKKIGFWHGAISYFARGINR